MECFEFPGYFRLAYRCILIVTLSSSLFACGGGGSGDDTSAVGQAISVINITGISPKSVPALSPDVTLTLVGKGFDNSSTVLWYGSIPLVTHYVSPTELQAVLPAADTAGTGPVPVSVRNGTSNIPTNDVTLLLTPPVSTVTSVSPSFFVIGSFTNSGVVDIYGTNFVDGALVMMGSNTLQLTTVLSTTHLQVILPSNVQVPQNTTVAISYMGGSPSNSVPFSMGPAPPQLGILSPASVLAGAQDFTLTVYGSAFSSQDVVQWNGGPLATTMVSASQLQAVVPSALSAAAGPATVTVHYAGAGSSTSGSASFTVSPTPLAYSNLNPGSIVAGGAGFILTVEGSGFTPASQVSWNGTPLTTSFVSAGQLQVSIPASYVQNMGASFVTVTTGAVTSQPLSFLAGQEGGFGYATIAVSQPVNDIVWDASQDVFYFSVGSLLRDYPFTAPPNHDTIRVYDVRQAAFTSTISTTGLDPDVLAISNDDQYLYVGEDTTGAIQRFALPALTSDISCPLGTFYGSTQRSPIDMQVSPTNPRTIAVSLGARGFSPAAGGITIMDDCSARPNVAQMYGGFGAFATVDSLQWNPDGVHIYGSDDETIGSSPHLFDVTVDSNGATISAALTANTASPIHYDAGDGLIFTDLASVVDPNTGNEVSWFGDESYGLTFTFVQDPATGEVGKMEAGVMLPDSSRDKAIFSYFVGVPNLFEGSIACFSVQTFSISTQAEGPGFIQCQDGGGLPIRMIPWGSNGVAVVVLAGGVHIVAGNVISGP